MTRLVVAVFLIASSTALYSGERPNILFAFADDWGRYASIYADEAVDGPGSVNDVISTPVFDKVARDGVLFKNAFVNAPSCTPCRSSLLSGQYFYRTGRGAILQGAIWDESIPSWPLLLNDAGYHIGKVYKVWSPGTPVDAPYGGTEYRYELPGPSFNGFSQTATKLVEEGKSVDEAKQVLLDHVGKVFEGFLDSQPEDKPFCFWFGPTNVHRKWIRGSGKALWDLDPEELKGKMPSFLPDVPEIREDFADYLGEVLAFDAGLGVVLEILEESGQLENTIVVVSGDHGAPGFPRGKCNLYDFGQAVPLAVSWPDKVKGNRVVEDFVNLPDLAPTLLEAAGVTPPEVMTGKTLMPVLESEEEGQVIEGRDWVVTGRERHVANIRPGFVPYPQRAIRTKEHLYIVNFEPDRWPMGTPGVLDEGATPSHDELVNDTFVCFGDVDAGPTKAWMVENRGNETYREAYELGFGKRPKYELYVLADDPDQVHNVAGEEEFASVQKSLHDRLIAELSATDDPRVTEDPVFERSPFTDEYVRPAKKKKK